jgi:hypothetical protein
MLKFVIFIASSMFLTELAVASAALITSEVPLAPVESLTKQELQSDVDLLVETLDKAYGGKGILPGSQYEDLIRGLTSLKLQGGSTSSVDFCNQLGALTEKVDDYHLTVHIAEQTCQRKWPTATVGPNSGYGKPNNTWSVAFTNYQNQLVPVLAIKKMTAAASPEWNGFFETVQGLVKTAKPFIIDLRRNPGGDSSTGYEMARILYGLDKSQQVPMPKKQIYRRRTPEAWTAMANTFWLEMQNLASKGQPIAEYQKANYKGLLGYRQKAIDGLMPEMEIETRGSEVVDLSHAVTAPIYVLIDRNCGSSCELTLEALENLPAVVTVGENTTGVVKYGNVAAVYLPASHIVIRLPTQGANYDDGRQVEKIGYAPKVKTPSGTDALEFTFNKFFQ